MQCIEATDVWVTIRTGTYAGLSGRIERRRETGVYVEIPQVGFVLVHVDDLDFRPQRQTERG